VCKVNDLEPGKTVQGLKGSTVQVKISKIYTVPSFVEYLRSGWQISFTCAIDYTASNGPYIDPSSLHFMGPTN
jgi:hypothetical protein